MPSQAAELEAPPQEQEPQDVQPAAFEEILAGPAGPIPPSDTPQDTEPAEMARKPITKPQGITAETWQRLNTKQKAYVVAYTEDPNALSAYIAAGYVQSRDGQPQDWMKRRAYSVHKGKAVRKALLEHEEQRAAAAEAEKSITLDKIVAELKHIGDLAIAKGDLAVAARTVELRGKTHGLFADVVVGDAGQRRQYSETERLEAARLSRLALLDGMGSEDRPAEAQPARGAEGLAPTPSVPLDTGGGGDSEEHTNSPITSSALPAPPPEDNGTPGAPGREEG